MWRKFLKLINDELGWKPGRSLIAVVMFLSLVLAVRQFLPPYRFNQPMSTVVLDCNGQLLGAQIAADGQWRFPASDDVPEKFKTCLLQFEDQYFYRHPGFNPLALARAAFQNVMAGKIVSGGSTITMQVIRLSRKGKSRNVRQKVIEIFLSVYSEVRFTKERNLRQYASSAPFGGNIVGLEAAAWRYFGRSPENLSWAEAACLAVLPNAPALIHPGRNRDALVQKRNNLLGKLLRKGIIDQITYELAIEEAIPEKPQPLPAGAMHLVSRMNLNEAGQQITTTIDLDLQTKVSQVVDRHHHMLAGNRIFNAAVLVLKVTSGEVVAYVGNTKPTFPGDHANQVDIIQRPRSSGSLLKPFLFAAMLSEGEVLPTALVADIPTTISSFTPKNFEVTYDGAVPAREALIRSLNIPAVRMLSSYGQSRFWGVLQEAGFSTIDRPAEHYGLSLILGGAEVTLWDACAAYQAMAKKLLEFDGQHHLQRNPITSPILVKDEISPVVIDLKTLDEAAIFLTLDAMKSVRRPDAEAGWESFLNSHSIAWKTGTSFGFRDAWAVGVTPDYVIGVWVGNADGEGRPGLIGVFTAAPLMFDVFSLLPNSGKWFNPPYDKMEHISVCRQSGMRPSPHCDETDSIWVNQAGLNTTPCPYHKPIHLDDEEKYRVTADCYPPGKIVTRSWFELPPAMAWYYKSKNPFYRSLPAWLPGCQPADENPMQLVWPDKPSKILVPRELDGKMGEVIFEMVHSQPTAEIFWYLNNEFLGTTRNIHKKGIQPPPGHHQLVLMDENGNIFTQAFEIVSR
ncbi:MAG: penicillin-binding protein 1C [Bacteroidales bacterium]|nr:penicillin-binding protein 1C [Bacteroidales bacterium]